LNVCVKNSTLAYESSEQSFKKDLDKVRLWFGDDSKKMVMKIKYGIANMQRVLIDPGSLLHFIDMRHQYKWSLRDSIGANDNQQTGLIGRVPGLASCYGNEVTKFIYQKICSLPRFYHPRLGLGIPVLVGERMLEIFRSSEEKATILYHEMTHKVLQTVDSSWGSMPIPI
jgi:hypothetical protein